VPFDSIPEILDELRAGRMIVLVDDERRENEGDLVCAAEFVTPDVVNFMVTEGRGLLCVALDGAICDTLDLAPQSSANTSQLATAYTITVDATEAFGITTGVSAIDRATTIQRLAHPDANVTDFAKPGHVNPLRARDGGVLVRTGQTEGSVDLCKLAGLRPAAAIIEVMNPDGTMARLDDLEAVCRKHSLKMCSVSDVIAHRLQREQLVERVDEAPFDTPEGQFRLIAYRSMVDPLPHVALCAGRVGQQTIDEPVLVRMHSQNLLGDVFGDTGQPSGQTLHQAMRKIQQAGEGAIVYMRQDGMGTGLLRRLQTLHDSGDTNRREVKAVMSKFDFGVGSQILHDLGVRQMKLLTNHPRKLHGLEGFGLSIVEHVKIG
jgi:3,4-dihydroxy 2-butanone 4-phosphate synthase/GTP cyclohydrolase II